jgi:beta-lactam-binding protein with PASTA domain
MTWDKALIEALRSNVVLVLDKLAYDDKVPEGTIIEQSLQPSMMITPGTVILLTVSKGPSPALTSVPNFVGETEGAARKLAVEYYLESEVAETVQSDQPEDQILAQDLPEGLEVKRGTKIRLTVSGGPRPVEVSEPEVGAVAALAPAAAEETPMPEEVEASETAGIPSMEDERTEGGGGGISTSIEESAAGATPDEERLAHTGPEEPADEESPTEEVIEIEALPPDLLDLTSEFDFSSVTRPEPTPPPAPIVEVEAPTPRARVMKSRRQGEQGE